MGLRREYPAAVFFCAVISQRIMAIYMVMAPNGVPGMWRHGLAGLVMMFGTLQPALAVDLVTGGFMSDADNAARLSGQDGTLSFGFTPRGGSGGAPVRVDIAAQPLERPSQPRVEAAASEDFVVGGALSWKDWTFGSSVLRLGSDDDWKASMVGAGVGYGKITARIAVGETQPPAGDARSTMLLSTDLAAWSWLTVEGDLALTGGSERRPDGDAAGRLGLRLSF